MASGSVIPVSADHSQQLNICRTWFTVLSDPSSDENRLKAAQGISENFETLMNSSQYPSFLDQTLKIFLKILQDETPCYISELGSHQLRKLIFEVIHRIPTNEHLRPHAKNILSLMFKLIEIENEENAVIGVRIIMELHKQYRPQFSQEIEHFLKFVKAVYQELPKNVDTIFDAENSIPLVFTSEEELNFDPQLKKFNSKTVYVEKQTAEGGRTPYTVLPMSMNSLKVLAELPIIVVLMYQLYKQNTQTDVAEFIPLVMKTITLRPPEFSRSLDENRKEVFVDFLAAQIKTLSFLAYIVRYYQNIVSQHANLLVKGLLSLLYYCPSEVAHLRKELLIAARHILSTDLRLKFVPYMPKLFDENILVGSGWTTYESLRPLAYSTLADLVHHVRQHLPLSDLTHAVHVFSKNVHDDSLPTSIQTMSCKLLLNLVDSIRQKNEVEPEGNGRDLLIRMLEVFVLKFKSISKNQLPTLLQKVQKATTDKSMEDIKGSENMEKTKLCQSLTPVHTVTVSDCRGLVKTLVCGVKTITWGCASCKTTSETMQNKQFHPKETLVFIRLVKWAMLALDVYTVGSGPSSNSSSQPGRSGPTQTVRSKEEKEVLEHFAGVFGLMNPLTFKEIFTVTIEFMVERIHKNYALQIVANSFLANISMSPIFATILVDFLLQRMEDMGSNVERSNLYLKLFKLVFGSVSLFANENEQMLKPHLRQIVNRSMELAVSAKEPYNYFLLLRALFRSIGGGSHDLLYQEFLPLLPNLLQGLNSLQSGLHKQHMKDLFVELCLTVPVRLSSLLPYLPMLMDPLVSALNGSPTLVSQGLRTLELCVDNLQPDFLYDHIQPVRAELMQALWRTLRNPSDQIAHVAFRVLGKFGGGNRKMMLEPQSFDYNNKEDKGPAVSLYFSEMSSPIPLFVDKIIETSLSALKNSSTELVYRKHCWELIKSYLSVTLACNDDKIILQKLLVHPEFSESRGSIIKTHRYLCSDAQAREVQCKALTALFVAAAVKDLRSSVLPFMLSLVRHYTLVAIVQESGPFSAGKLQYENKGMDPLVLIDALASVMGHEEKELCKPGHTAMVFILDTAISVLGSKEKACELSFMEYLAEKMYSLCYEQPWYTKLGGCIGVRFLFERMSLQWILDRQGDFLRAMLYIMMDLTGEVSSGAVDKAKSNIEKMLTICASPLPVTASDELINAQKNSIQEVVHELVRQVTSPNSCVREQATSSLQLIARIQSKSVTEVMKPHKDILADMIPPKKHLLRHQPVNSQIGLMEGNYFCTTLEPRLFTIDLSIPEHKNFFNELFYICEAEDAQLNKLPCYKSVTNLIPLRKSALKALAACYYVQHCKDKIFSVLYKALNSSNNELQESGFHCMQTFISGSSLDSEVVHTSMRPLLSMMGDYRSLTLNVIQRLSYLTQLFPYTFNEKLCEQLVQHLKKWLEVVILGGQKSRFGAMEIEVSAAIINIFHQIPAASHKLIEPLCKLTLQTEKALFIEAGSPFREPLAKFLVRYPQESIEFILENACSQQWSRFLIYLLKWENGKPFREVFQSAPNKLVYLSVGDTPPVSLLKREKSSEVVTDEGKVELKFLSIRVTSILIDYDNQWLSSQVSLIESFKNIWKTYDLKRNLEKVDYSHWQEPHLLCRVLLHYFTHHTEEIDLLFDLLKVLSTRIVPEFQFLKEFLELTVSQTYSSDWKRNAFLMFVKIHHDPNTSEDLKSRILQHVIIPCFLFSFEKGEVENVIGTTPDPDFESSEDLVSVFIHKVIDPDNPFGNSDAVRILLLQFSCLLVEYASKYIHDPSNRKQGNKLRRLMTFAWPCLLTKNYVDPTTKYHGHLLLSYIIAKFAIHKRIILQVFHSLLKAHAVEAKAVVKQALDILTPAMPLRMEDGNTMLIHWTKKIIVEEGHSIAQLVHILHLIVRHSDVYYDVRHHLIPHMVSAIQRLGFQSNTTLDYKKLAVDLAEVILKWEIKRASLDNIDSEDAGNKRSSTEKGNDSKMLKTNSGKVSSSDPAQRPIDRVHSDAVINLLTRIACQQVYETSSNTSAGEVISRKCLALLKMALKPDVWPVVELKLSWFDKFLLTADSVNAGNVTPNSTVTNICNALDLLSFLLSVLRKDQILSSFKPLQKGIAICLNVNNSKVIKSVHTLMSRLMNHFPTEPTSSSVASKHEELETLYAAVGKAIYEGLSNFEKNTSLTSSSLFGTLMILKAACGSNPCYVDRLITSFMRVLQKMTREHLSSTSDASSITSEMLILCLDLVKNRIGVMGVEMRKAFIGNILVGLIEKSTDVKVLKAITKMMEDWIKNKSPVAINQGPSCREKSILLVRMMQHLEKRFPDDLELQAQFLDIVNHVYRDDSLKGSEITTKLEPAFLSGLRCIQPHIRTKFFQVFDSSMRKRLHDRLLYIVCSQNWEAMGPHFWIKQCIELLLVTCSFDKPLEFSKSSCLLPSITSVIQEADSLAVQTFMHTTFVESVSECETQESCVKEEEMVDMDLSTDSTSHGDSFKKESTTNTNLHMLIQMQTKFLESISEIRAGTFIEAVCQLCHMETTLADKVWVDIFPLLWAILGERQQNSLAGEIVPFLCSGAHVVQKDCFPSALNTFIKGLANCNPSIPIKPCLMKYLGKSHNLWHRMTLNLESMVSENASVTQHKGHKDMSDSCYEFEPSSNPQQESLEALADMYSLLKEEDMWAGLWLKRAKYTETNLAIVYEQHGYFEQAQGAYELAMSKARKDYNECAAPAQLHAEYKLWDDHWIRCSMELNQWDLLLDYGSNKSCSNPFLVLESAWRVPNWALMKEALSQVELSFPKEIAWKVNLYRGFLAICHPEEQHLSMVERLVESAAGLCIKEWRRLPEVVSHVHLPLLQAAQQVMELQEAAQIHQGLLHSRSSSHHDMKAIVKTWRNRLPILSDDLSHWSDIFTWRQHHYQFIVSHYDQKEHSSNHSMLGVHASAQAIIHYGKIARKHNLTGVCLDSLSRIHTIPSVPIVDCFQKIRQQVKCYLQMASITGKNELQEGLEVIESTNLKYFSKEMTAEFYAMKGLFLSQLGRSEEANKAFSAAVQMHDTLIKAWALWGDFLEQGFTKDPRQITWGAHAITCFLHACRIQNEPKARKYIAKVLWLLTFDDEKCSLADTIDKYYPGVPHAHWLPWIPQLLTCLVRNEGKLIINLLSQVGRVFPQAVYFPIRTLYLTLKIEQRERYKNGELTASERASVQSGNSSTANTSDGASQNTDVGGSANQGQQKTQGSDANPIRATAPMWRCSRIMHMQRELHPTILSSLEGIVDQMVWFRETWYEEVLRQLRQGLAKCYAIAFENRGAVSDAIVTPHTVNFMMKLVATFGIGVEGLSSGNTKSEYGSAASESLIHRAHVTGQDPLFKKLRGQFSFDFDFTQPGAMKLHNLINKFRKWIKTMEAKVKLLPKSFLMDEKCRFLSNFSLQTAEVELPGEFLLPKHSHYYVKIARFIPSVEIVQKHNTAARRLYIRGHNGKLYPYLVVIDSSLRDARSQERALQLLRMLNHYLSKQKETSKRFLNFSVARVVAVSPQMRLVQDNTSSVSLFEIYRQSCLKRSIEYDTPIVRYYDRLATVQARGAQASHQVLRDILKDVQLNMVPKTMLKQWALKIFPSATSYWTFRKMFTLQLALIGFAEYVLHFTRLNPDMLYLHQDSGLANVAYFKFDVEDLNGGLDANRPVPFRLTPNISEYLTMIGVNGPLTAAMIAAARALHHPNFKIQALLRAVLRDEIIFCHKKFQRQEDKTYNPDENDNEAVVSLVNKAVSAIINRLQSLAAFDGLESKITTLVAAANSHDNLCRMDPAWHPWL